MKSLGDAIELRNQLIAQLEEADFECSLEERRPLLTVLVAGGGFAGVETVAAVNDFVGEAIRFYPNITQKDVRVALDWTLDVLFAKDLVQFGTRRALTISRRAALTLVRMSRRASWEPFRRPRAYSARHTQPTARLTLDSLAGDSGELQMRKRNALIGLAIVVVAGGWYAFRPERLFVNQTVNESLGAVSAPPGATEAAPTTLSMGTFHSNAHDTKGTATVLDLGGGRRVLRLTNFATSNGPDVRVYLVAAADVQDNNTVKTAGFVELGPMKGNIGDQNYDIPATVDLANYRTVTIWCKRFSVNFGSAPLT